MKKFLQRLGVRKMDEMERHILFRAQRSAYFFLIAALLIQSFYESAQVYLCHTRLNPVPCMLLAGAVLVQAVSQLVLARRAVQGDEDSWETEPLARLAVLVFVLEALAAAVGAAVVLLTVRL